MTATTTATLATDFTLQTPSGEPLPLSRWTGHPMLIVNTASRCGFTPQYAALQQLWTDYESRGLVVLGVPSNDFGRQEPGTDAEIGAFCTTRFAATFPLAAKTSVTGPDATPLFRWLANEAGALGKPRWNFFKYLVDRHGHLHEWFASITKPDSAKVRHAIERCLAA